MGKNPRSTIIANLNDQLRKTGIGGKVVMTCGVQALDAEMIRKIYKAVQEFNIFNEENDPRGEHDFGIIDSPGIEKCYWKIDYYDKNLEYGSEDPADPAQTCRVLTIMRPLEY